MLDLVIDSRPRDLGGGLTVGRILPYAKRRMVGPFAFLDHMGPAAFAPGEGIDVRPHPHIGLSTVTYLFEGEILHRDSLGSLQAIRPDAVNWMTAGRGIVHSERTDPLRRAAGGPLHGVQAWVALPEADEEADPAFAHHPEAGLPTLAAEGIWLRLIAGAAFGLASAVVTHSPLFYAHAELAAGARLALPEEHEERAAFVVAGAVEHAGTTVAAGQLLVLKPGGAPELTAAAPSRLMLLGGAPLGPRRIWWNFVSSRPERIEQAKADWRARRMTMPPGDSVEFVPLPE